MSRKRVRVKPGKTQSAMGFIVGIVFVLIGLFMVVPMFGLFGLLWTGMAVVITVINGLNAFGKKGVPTMEIYSEEEDEPLSPAREDHDHIPSTALTTQERLEQLQTLKEAGLLTDEEYRNKREEILKGL